MNLGGEKKKSTEGLCFYDLEVNEMLTSPLWEPSFYFTSQTTRMLNVPRDRPSRIESRLAAHVVEIYLFTRF